MDYQPKPLPFSKQLDGISEKTLSTHHDKLYVGYVNKSKEISEKLAALREKILSGEESGNQSYSILRGLKEGETFSLNGVYLHERYFDVLGGDPSTSSGQAAPELSKAISEKWGSVENFIKYFSECGMAARGWAVLAWDTRQGKLAQFNADAHNQGGVWGALPIIVLDVYEHAYFIDFGSDRKAYIAAFWKNFNWAKAEELYLKVRGINL
jgi:Fe-Mn family superoxide dismutase